MKRNLLAVSVSLLLIQSCSVGDIPIKVDQSGRTSSGTTTSTG